MLSHPSPRPEGYYATTYLLKVVELIGDGPGRFHSQFLSNVTLPASPVQTWRETERERELLTKMKTVLDSIYNSVTQNLNSVFLDISENIHGFTPKIPLYV